MFRQLRLNIGLSRLSPVLILLTVIACNPGDSIAANSDYCNNPVEVGGLDQEDSYHENLVFIVSIHDSIDVNAIAVELMDKYKDLEIYKVVDIYRLNFFTARLGLETLNRIRCEPSVDYIRVDMAYPPT